MSRGKLLRKPTGNGSAVCQQRKSAAKFADWCKVSLPMSKAETVGSLILGQETEASDLKWQASGF